MSCEKMTSMLNAMQRLYEKAVDQGKPYRIHRIKQLYNDFKTQAAEIFDMVPLDSVESYEHLLGPLPEVRKVMQLKNDAISNFDYESAAIYRSQEKKYIELKLETNGLGKVAHYFCFGDGKIFYKSL